MLHAHSSKGNPLGADFRYAEEFAKLDVEALKRDIAEVLTTSQDWWPADFGHYGGLMIRMSWHAAGTYRIYDGRGGAGDGGQRFAPLNSWPDNANLDKARRLLWPVKQKYGQTISWADLLVLAGNVALESMGFETFGFGFGREDVWEPEEIFWGPEDTWLGDERYTGERELHEVLGAVQMGLIYVNPEGPNGNPDPLASARDIRETFARMAMNDEETVALIAGGHTFGKTHGAGDADLVGPEPEGAPLEEQGLGWMSSYGSGKGADTITSGLEVTWTDKPTQWSNRYFEILFGYEWELTESPAGAKQWVAKDAEDIIPGPTPDSPKRKPTMLTSDLALRFDPTYEKISRRFLENPDEFRARLRQGLVQAAAPRHGPGQPLPRPVGAPSRSCGRTRCRPSTTSSSPTTTSPRSRPRCWTPASPTAQLVSTAWASAATFRSTDKRGGANGARIRLEPQRGWEVNQPEQLATVLETLEGIQRDFNEAGGAQISLADLIVLAGSAAVEKAARDAGVEVTVPFHAGSHRRDAGADRRRLVPGARAARRRLPQLPAARREDAAGGAAASTAPTCSNLTAPEMTVLVGGLRALGRQRRRRRSTACSPTGPACSPTTSSPTCSPRARGGRRRSPRRTSTRSATWPPTR